LKKVNSFRIARELGLWISTGLIGSACVFSIWVFTSITRIEASQSYDKKEVAQVKSDTGKVKESQLLMRDSLIRIEERLGIYEQKNWRPVK
jgi:hypothetical protein